LSHSLTVGLIILVSDGVSTTCVSRWVEHATAHVFDPPAYAGGTDLSSTKVRVTSFRDKLNTQTDSATAERDNAESHLQF